MPPHLCADIRRSATMPVMLMGCEWIALAFTGMSTMIIAVSIQPYKIGLTLAAVWGLIWREAFRYMARKDPILIRVYLGNRRYADGFWTALPSSYGPRSKGVLAAKVVEQAVYVGAAAILLFIVWLFVKS